MVKATIIVAAVALVVSLGAFIAAGAITGGQIVRGDGWPASWTVGNTRTGEGEADWRTPRTTRQMAWAGGDVVIFEAPARIVFRNGPIVPLTISGPQAVLDRLVLDDGVLRFTPHAGKRHGRFGKESETLQVTMTASNIRRFVLRGAQDLTVEDFDGQSLEVEIRGAGVARLSGRVDRLELDIKGAGNIDASGLAVRDAKVDIRGAGAAKVGPTESADIEISGVGTTVLLTEPRRLSTRISGLGSVNRDHAPVSPKRRLQPAA